VRKVSISLGAGHRSGDNDGEPLTIGRRSDISKLIQGEQIIHLKWAWLLSKRCGRQEGSETEMQPEPFACRAARAASM
jgi:hypothetical protein